MKGIEWDCKGLESITEEAIKEKSDLSLKAIQDKNKFSALMQLQMECCKKLLLLNNIDYHNLYQTTNVFLNTSKHYQKSNYQLFDLHSQMYFITPHIWCCHDSILYFREYE